MSDEITASLEVLAQSAEQGNSDSMHLLGKHYFECGDHVQAEKWYLRSIELGNVNSMVNIGVLYFTDGDIDKAKYWYQHASDFGDSGGMYNLAVLLDAIGLREESADWFKKAAELGDSSAMYNLALYFDETGRKEESIAWYYKAIAAGDEDAENNLGILLRKLGRESELKTLDINIKTNLHHIPNLFFMLSPVDEVSEHDKEFNVALRTLQQFPDDNYSLNVLGKLVDRNHDKARMASALRYLLIGNEKEATYDLRHVDNVEDPEFNCIIDMLSSEDDANEPIQNQKITSEMAEFVLDQWEIISESDSLYWLDAFWTADITAELFLQGCKITDYEIVDFLFAYETLSSDPVSPEYFE